MSKKITQLPTATAIADDDKLLIVDTSDGLSKQVDRSVLVGAPQVVTGELFDEFVEYESSIWDDTNSTGTGVVSFLAAGNAEHDEGFGIVALDTGAGIGTAQYIHGAGGTPVQVFRGSFALAAELRVKLPATPTDVGFEFGFGDGGTSFVFARYDEGVGTWTFASSSTAGASSDSDATAVAAVAGWNTLRIEVDPGVAARFYVNGTLVSTLTTAAAILQGNDQTGPYMLASTAGATAGAVYVDWFRATAART